MPSSTSYSRRTLDGSGVGGGDDDDGRIHNEVYLGATGDRRTGDGAMEGAVVLPQRQRQSQCRGGGGSGGGAARPEGGGGTSTRGGYSPRLPEEPFGFTVRGRELILNDEVEGNEGVDALPQRGTRGDRRRGSAAVDVRNSSCGAPQQLSLIHI